MLLVTRFSELEDREEAYGYHVTKPQKMPGPPNDLDSLQRRCFWCPDKGLKSQPPSTLYLECALYLHFTLFL